MEFLWSIAICRNMRLCLLHLLTLQKFGSSAFSINFIKPSCFVGDFIEYVLCISVENHDWKIFFDFGIIFLLQVVSIPGYWRRV